jgi:hypothetical protein
MQAYLEKHHIIIHGGEESSIEPSIHHGAFNPKVSPFNSKTHWMVMHEEEEEEDIQELLWLELTVGSSLSSPMCCGCENKSLVGVNHAWNELSTLKKEPNFKAKL